MVTVLLLLMFANQPQTLLGSSVLLHSFNLEVERTFVLLPTQRRAGFILGYILPKRFDSFVEIPIWRHCGILLQAEYVYTL